MSTAALSSLVPVVALPSPRTPTCCHALPGGCDHPDRPVPEPTYGRHRAETGPRAVPLPRTPRPGCAEPVPELVLAVQRVDPEPAVPGPTDENHAEADGDVTGAFCAAGHFTHPDAYYCHVCGIGLVQAGHVVGTGVRPSVGVLVVDDGTVLALRRDVVCGSAPESLQDVAMDAADGIRLPGTGPVQCRIRALDWNAEVTNLSEQPLHVANPDSPHWRTLHRGEVARLAPGGTVAVRDRRIRFETHLRPA